jgi:TRAP-type C4-dicarboxylate transport system substrate-binding protein
VADLNPAIDRKPEGDLHEDRRRPSLVRPVALALAAPACSPAAALAQFQERTLRLSVPVPKEHPQGNGVAKMSACTLDRAAAS